MDNITNFILDAEQVEIFEAVLGMCHHKGIDPDKIEGAVLNVVSEPDVRTIDFMIVKRLLEV